MIEASCVCGAIFRTAENQLNFAQRCRNCGALIMPVCAEQLGEGAGAADFDALLFVESGPKRAGEVLLLGGVPNIDIGKRPGNHILLDGELVSRNHGFLRRIDFGPSQWQLEDHGSTNGIYVNGFRISSHPLIDGDRITLGEFELIYRSMYHVTAAPPALPTEPPPIPTAHFAPASAPPVPASAPLPPGAARGIEITTGGPICPSCNKSLAPNARICIACGINVFSGRPLLTSGGMDEDVLVERASEILRWISWILPWTIFPLPIASEAFGTRKPYAIWGIAAFTILVSLIFFIAQQNSDGQAGRSLMLWPPSDQTNGQISDASIEKVVHALGERAVLAFEAAKKSLKGSVPDKDLSRKAFESTFGELPKGEPFHWWQLFTHILLHDPSNIYAFTLHLGGNMVFLLVFGSRVNALIGDIPTLIIYPILGVIAGLSQNYFTTHLIPIPSLGASGAINGLAGMYLILFPIHRIYCAWWFRLRFIVPLKLKIVPIRGFWILLIYFAWDLLSGLLSRDSIGGGTADWAHVGGFVAGAVIALGLLLSRQFNTRGGDMLSVIPGKRAWPLIGKPSRWIATPPPLPTVRAVSLNFEG